ncbi:MAG: nucleotidyltransferase family protein [Thermoanaerobaculia bacterium]|nr:nucleotidyltransferase family protein [Thermoanaerobaculia bacterium]
MSVARVDLAVRIKVSPEAVAGFCRRNHIRKLSLFGSVLRDDFRPESDVDVLVEFEAGKAPGFIRLARMEGELSGMLGRRVDLLTPASISPHFRQKVLAEALPLHDAA